MKKRELVIIGIALLAVIYGALDYLVFSNSSKDKGLKNHDVEMKELDKSLVFWNAELSEVDRSYEVDFNYLITMAETKWKKDPFIESDFEGENSSDDNSDGENLVELIYSGFLTAGENILAVINGMEYNIGDILLEIGYEVISITPESVVLLTEFNKEIIIFLEEN